MVGVKDPDYATEVYSLQGSNPDGKVVIRKGRDVVVIWPGDLEAMIDRLIDLEWERTLDTQHTAE